MNKFDSRYHSILDDIIAEGIIKDFNDSVRSNFYESDIIDESILENVFKSLYEKMLSALGKAKELSLSAYSKVVKALVNNPIVSKVLKFFGISKSTDAMSNEIGSSLMANDAIVLVDDENVSGYTIDKDKIEAEVDEKCSKLTESKKGISGFFKKLIHKLVMLMTTLFIISTILSSSNAEAASAKRRSSYRSQGSKIVAQYLDKKTGKKCSYIVKNVDGGKVTIHIRYDNNNDGVINASDSLGGIPDGVLTYSSKEALLADFNGGRFDNTSSNNSNVDSSRNSSRHTDRFQSNSTNSSNGAGIRAGKVYDINF